MEDLGTSFQKKYNDSQVKQAESDLDSVFAPVAGDGTDEKPFELPPIPVTAEPLTDEEKPAVPGKLSPRRETDDPMGRLQPNPEDESTAGKVMRHAADVIPSAARGVHDAVYNATAFLQPITDWLNENVADLSYTLEGPDTFTGEVVKSATQFLVGFVPAVKALKAAGMTGKVTTPMAAGAISDFATRDGHEGRLFDIWRQVGLPENEFVNFMETDQESPELVERFKNALEGAGIGVAVDGILMAARLTRNMLRANKEVNGPGSEIAVLKEKYGELTDEEIAKRLGDPTKPMVETHVVPAPAVSKKIPKAEGELPNLEPRAVIRTQKKTKVEPAKPFLYDYQNVFTKEAIANAEKNAVAGNAKARVVMMKVDDYIALAYPREETYRNLSKKQIAALAEEKRGPIRAAINKGGIDEVPWLDIDNGRIVGHDGRHRADVLKEMGFDEIPVMVKGKVPESGTLLVSENGVTTKIRLPDALVRPSAEAKAGVKSEDFETYINFARIDEPEQVKFTIGKMAEAMKGSIDEARRGKITQEETQKMADELGMTVSDLMERRRGQPLNAEEALAARQLWAASAEKLLTAAKVAAGPNAGPLDQFAFRRLMAVHSAIQNEVIGARTETARALAAWKIPAGGGVERARAIDQIMQAAGGPEASKDMARRLAILAETGADPAAISRFVARGWGAKSADIVREVWVNGLLSSPKTHIVNITSNTGVALQQIYERAVAGGIRGAIGGDGVKVSESVAMLYGLLGGTKDAFRMAAKSLKTGETGYAFNKIDVTHPNSISSEAFNLSNSSSTGKFVDFIGHAATVPGRLLGAEDEFFKTIGYRMEVHAQAMRQATNEGLSGDAAFARMRELVNDPPEHIRINAADAAMYNTFTNEVGWFGKAVMNLRDSGSPIGQVGLTFVLPFVRTPTNIARYTFERTPFAPLVGQWRADIAAGGARADLALARMSTGTAIMLTAMDWATSGTISGAGPKDPGEREALIRQGWQPYSMMVGDRWYSYSRTDPFGSTMGFAASITEAINRGEIDQEDVDEWQEVVGMAIAAVSQVAINKTYLEGVANVVEMMGDPTRYSEGYINDLFASFVPFTALSGAVETAVDPTQRDVGGPWDAINAKIAGLSEKLPPRRNLWGEEIRTESGLGKVYDFISPVASRALDVSPIDKELTRLGGGPQRIKKRTYFDGVQVSLKSHPDVYDEYTRLAGNELKHPAWQMGAKDYLNAVVLGNHPMSTVYNMLSDEGRREFVENTISGYRKLAQRQILSDPKHAKFAAQITYLKQAAQQSRMPVLEE